MEKKYGRQLRQIAGYIDSIIKGFDVTDETVYPSIVTALRKYAESLDVWAVNASSRILMDVALRDEKTWLIHAKDMSIGVKHQIRNTDVGAVTPLEYRDLRQLTTYFGRLGAVEWVYPETAYYADGL